MKQEKKDIGSFRFEELKEEMTSIGEKAFRAKQVYEWLHVKLVRSFDEMTNLSKSLREKLARQYEIREVEMLDRQVSAMDGTNKFLFRLSDGHVVESVLMKYKHGNSVCISSQVGCRMGCRFCASTIGGLERNLTPSEMLGQIYQIQRIAGERVANVVVMGTGEPLDNYENLLKFIQMLTDEHGLHISQRNVTVSTCGIVPKMLELAEEHLQITLALSLHGSTQEKRKKLMPVANKYELSEVLEACDIYFAKTGRRMTFEYSLVHGVNDTEEDAKELSALLSHKNCHINLIPSVNSRITMIAKPGYNTAEHFQIIHTACFLGISKKLTSNLCHRVCFLLGLLPRLCRPASFSIVSRFCPGCIGTSGNTQEQYNKNEPVSSHLLFVSAFFFKPHICLHSAVLNPMYL